MARRMKRPLAVYTPVTLFGVIIGLGCLGLTLLTEPPMGWSREAWWVAGLGALMAALWMTEALPLAVTALLPILLAPVLGLAPMADVTAAYAHPLIFLFLGGFVLGLAMQRWHLHERIALNILAHMGATPARELAGFMLATAFLSMWVSNTATTIMMLPIALSVVAQREGERCPRYAVVLLLGIAYAASVGGIATLIGTPPNALLAAYLSDQHGVELGFAGWMAIGLPVSAVMLVAVWLWLGRGLSPQQGAGSGNGHEVFRQRLEELGPMSTMEKRVAVVFVLTAATWVFQPLLAGRGLGLPISDTGIAIACAVLLHALPAGDHKGQRLMDWASSQRLPWGVLLLFGGGLALAGLIQTSGLAGELANLLQPLGGLAPWVLIVAVVLMVVFLTEVTSNTATTAAFLPLLGALAVAIGLPPESLAIPAAIAASCAFMMPVATPPNAIVFASGHVRIGDMIAAGFALNLLGAAVVVVAALLI